MALFLHALTLPNINRLSKSFHYKYQGIRRKFVIILSLKIPPHLKCVATLPCEMSSVLKATIENKTTSVTIHFKKLTTQAGDAADQWRDQWRRRLECVVQQQGGHIEHLM